jgi:hypothetical protein
MIKTNKNSFKIIMWLVMGLSNDSFSHKSLFGNQNFITFFMFLI